MWSASASCLRLNGRTPYCAPNPKAPMIACCVAGLWEPSATPRPVPASGPGPDFLTRSPAWCASTCPTSWPRTVASPALVLAIGRIPVVNGDLTARQGKRVGLLIVFDDREFQLLYN